MNAPRIIRILLSALALVYQVPRSVSAGLIMRIDTENDFFYMEGSDTGNAFQSDPQFEDYSLQFLHEFATQPSASATITSAPQNLFVQATTLPITGGNMNMIRAGAGPGYVFIDLFANSDITILTGKGSSDTVSYASLPSANQTLFESMIGQTMPLTVGTGYSPISVQAVPEPSICVLSLAGLACGGYSMFRRPKRA